MAFDGITIAAVMEELTSELTGGRILKIAQPEKDELILTVKNNNNQYRLLISADPSLPLIYLTQANKPSPITAPTFCMLLRKYLQNARIIGFEQPDFERIVRMKLEHTNELGDLCEKTLIVELMGRYSNIILVDEESNIIDSIRRVSSSVSSVREVLPGRKYFLPEILEKKNPLNAVYEDFLRKSIESGKDMPIFKAIYTEYTGIAPVIAKSICAAANVPQESMLSEADGENMQTVWKAFNDIMECCRQKKFRPCMYYENGIMSDYAPIILSIFEERKEIEGMSALLSMYYSEKNVISRIRQRSYDIRRIVTNAVERTKKKLELQDVQFADTDKRDDYRIYGELLNTYGYSAKPGDKSIEVLNYYTNENITIPLDPTLSAKDNAKRYFGKYNKLKRTFEALTVLREENKKELMHLESILMSLDIARSEEDLVQIKEELIDSGYVRRRRNLKKPKITSTPFHYVNRDGYDIYVGKNNYQNDELSFKLATGRDMWFHAKNAPGSHVIVKNPGGTIPDSVYVDAASLAAYYSTVRNQDKVEIDYTEKKNLKKPPKAAPGYVIYHTNYSMMATPCIPEGVTLVK